jgi:hypothetical protein
LERFGLVGASSLYARRLPFRSLRHAHQVGIEKLIYGQG